MARTPTKPQRSIASFFRPGEKEVAAEGEVAAEETRKDQVEAKPSVGSESEGDGDAKMMSMQVVEDLVEDVVVPKEDGMERTSRKVSRWSGRLARKRGRGWIEEELTESCLWPTSELVEECESAGIR